jgi:hypothetical protein
MVRLMSVAIVRDVAVHALIKSGDDPGKVATRYGLKRDTVLGIYRKRERLLKAPPPPIEDIATSSLSPYIRSRLLAAGFKTFGELAKVPRAHVLTPKGTFKCWLGPYSIICINMYMERQGMPYRIENG